MKLTREEKKILDEHVIEQKQLRKVDKSLKNSADFEEHLELIKEQSFFKLGEFLIEHNFAQDKEKLEKVWKYLRKKLS